MDELYEAAAENKNGLNMFKPLLVFFCSLTLAPYMYANDRDYLTLASDALACSYLGSCDALNISARMQKIHTETLDIAGFDTARFEVDLLQIAEAANDIPWALPRSFSDNTLALVGTRKAEEQDLNYLLEFMLMQYLARVRLELFETAPEDQGALIAMTDFQVAEYIDSKFRQRFPEKELATWDYLRLTVKKGRDYLSPIKPTPYLVYTLTRKMQAGGLTQ